MEKTQVTVIDSLMGTGKTSWAIQHMENADGSKKFIYITPFLDEIENRILPTLAEKNFVQPEAIKGKNKKDSLKSLIAGGMNIVSTHALFKKLDEPMIELLKSSGYTLILDEVMNVLEQEKITASDLKMLLETGKLTVKDESGFCQWNDKEYVNGKPCVPASKKKTAR